MSIRCFYHKADFDGLCSGAIVKYRYPKSIMYPIDYGDEFPWDIIDSDDKIIMVDFGLPIDDMIKLESIVYNSLIWIDHHITNIEAKIEKELHFFGIQEVGRAGCELTWDYFYNTEVPYAVYLLGRYDVWDFKDSNTLPFQYGMRSSGDWNPNKTEAWGTLFQTTKEDATNPTSFISQTICDGQTIIRYSSSSVQRIFDLYAFKGAFGDLKALYINSAEFGAIPPDARKTIFTDEYDIFIGFMMSPKGEWKVSLRSTKDDVHCGHIAQEYGGGGHPHAAGFQTNISQILQFIDRRKEK